MATFILSEYPLFENLVDRIVARWSAHRLFSTGDVPDWVYLKGLGSFGFELNYALTVGGEIKSLLRPQIVEANIYPSFRYRFAVSPIDYLYYYRLTPCRAAV